MQKNEKMKWRIEFCALSGKPNTCARGAAHRRPNWQQQQKRQTEQNRNANNTQNWKHWHSSTECRSVQFRFNEFDMTIRLTENALVRACVCASICRGIVCIKFIKYVACILLVAHLILSLSKNGLTLTK